ncbi:hypothetical protein AOLI_G00231880 [Acnodon oligacanthus]
MLRASSTYLECNCALAKLLHSRKNPRSLAKDHGTQLARTCESALAAVVRECAGRRGANGNATNRRARFSSEGAASLDEPASRGSRRTAIFLKHKQQPERRVEFTASFAVRSPSGETGDRNAEGVSVKGQPKNEKEKENWGGSFERNPQPYLFLFSPSVWTRTF